VIGAVIAAAAALMAAPAPAPVHAHAAAAPLPRPHMIQWRIPYGTKRKREMAAYSKRHYGVAQWRLTHPKTIVEHISVAGTARADYNTFASDRPDVEFGELPNVCAHFVVNAKGQIFEMVPTTIRCRHTVGLNDTAIGIEHVGYRDADLLGRRAELRASLKLTRWLRCVYDIRVERVIGHNESLSSPFHHERVARLRHQTHGDMRHASMVTYRRKLRALGRCPATG
jgi:N-acetylmuramoyl-L-alanine amidase